MNGKEAKRLGRPGNGRGRRLVGPRHGGEPCGHGVSGRLAAPRRARRAQWATQGLAWAGRQGGGAAQRALPICPLSSLWLGPAARVKVACLLISVERRLDGGGCAAGESGRWSWSRGAEPSHGLLTGWRAGQTRDARRVRACGTLAGWGSARVWGAVQGSRPYWNSTVA